MFCIEMHWERLMMAAAMNFATFFYSLPTFLYNLPFTVDSYKPVVEKIHNSGKR